MKWDSCPLFLLIGCAQIVIQGGLDRKGWTMNGAEVLRIVDAIHRDKNIDKE